MISYQHINATTLSFFSETIIYSIQPIEMHQCLKTKIFFTAALVELRVFNIKIVLVISAFRNGVICRGRIWSSLMPSSAA